MSFQNSFVASLMVSFVIGLVGCGEAPQPLAQTEQEPQTVDSGQKTTSATPVDPALAAQAKRTLVGIWLGLPQLDEQRLKEKLANLDGESKANLLNFVSNFKTTAMAIQYHENGTVYTEVNARVGNNPVFEASEGSWEISRARTNQMSVNVVEKLTNGSLSQTTYDYTVVENGNVLVATIPTHPDLADLNPTFVFTREKLDQVTAQNPDETTSR